MNIVATSERVVQSNGTLPVSARLLNALPHPLKNHLVLQRTMWRVCHGICRRSGWDASQLGWWTIKNGPYGGMTLEIWHTNQLARRIGIYEPAVTRWLQRYLSERVKQFGPQRVWDVGANMGLLSMLCARYGQGPVTAFEPLDENINRMRAHLERNPEVADRIELVQTAVSDRVGETAFSMPGATDQCQIRDDRMGQKWNVDAPTVTVPVTTLDAHAGGCDGGPTFIKIDVEGAEELVLAGASDVLEKYRPTLLIEVHGDEEGQGCVARLASYDYETTVLDRDGTERTLDSLPSYGHVIARPRS